MLLPRSPRSAFLTFVFLSLCFEREMGPVAHTHIYARASQASKKTAKLKMGS